MAAASGTYAAALRFHMSGPIAVVTGILIGNRGTQDAMRDLTQRDVFGFRQMVDEILNSISLHLFLLIGLGMLVVSFDPAFAWISLAGIPLVLPARFPAVSLAALAANYAVVVFTIVVQGLRLRSVVERLS